MEKAVAILSPKSNVMVNYSNKHIFNAEHGQSLHMFDVDALVDKKYILTNPIGWSQVTLMLKVKKNDLEAVISDINSNIYQCMKESILLYYDYSARVSDQPIKNDMQSSTKKKISLSQIPIISLYGTTETTSSEKEFNDAEKTLVLLVQSPPRIDELEIFQTFVNDHASDKKFTMDAMMKSKSYQNLLKSSLALGKYFITTALFRNELEQKLQMNISSNGELQVDGTRFGMPDIVVLKFDSLLEEYLITTINSMELLYSYENGKLPLSNSSDTSYDSYVLVDSYRDDSESTDVVEPMALSSEIRDDMKKKISDALVYIDQFSVDIWSMKMKGQKDTKYDELKKTYMDKKEAFRKKIEKLNDLYKSTINVSSDTELKRISLVFNEEHELLVDLSLSLIDSEEAAEEYADQWAEKYEVVYNEQNSANAMNMKKKYQEAEEEMDKLAEIWNDVPSFKKGNYNDLYSLYISTKKEVVALFDLMSQYYKDHGYKMFSTGKSYRINESILKLNDEFNTIYNSFKELTEKMNSVVKSIKGDLSSEQINQTEYFESKILEVKKTLDKSANVFWIKWTDASEIKDDVRYNELKNNYLRNTEKLSNDIDAMITFYNKYVQNRNNLVRLNFVKLQFDDKYNESLDHYQILLEESKIASEYIDKKSRSYESGKAMKDLKYMMNRISEIQKKLDDVDEKIPPAEPTDDTDEEYVKLYSQYTSDVQKIDKLLGDMINLYEEQKIYINEKNLFEIPDVIIKFNRHDRDIKEYFDKLESVEKKMDDHIRYSKFIIPETISLFNNLFGRDKTLTTSSKIDTHNTVLSRKNIKKMISIVSKKRRQPLRIAINASSSSTDFGNDNETSFVVPPESRIKKDRTILDMFSSEYMMLHHIGEENNVMSNEKKISKTIVNWLVKDGLVYKNTGVYEFAISHDTIVQDRMTQKYFEDNVMPDGMTLKREMGKIYALLVSFVKNSGVNNDTWVFNDLQSLFKQINKQGNDQPTTSITPPSLVFTLEKESNLVILDSSMNYFPKKRDEIELMRKDQINSIKRDITGRGIEIDSIKLKRIPSLKMYLNNRDMLNGKILEILSSVKYATNTFDNYNSPIDKNRAFIPMTEKRFPKYMYVFDPEDTIGKIKENIPDDNSDNVNSAWPSNIQEVWNYDGFLIAMQYFLIHLDDLDRNGINEYRKKLENYIQLNVLEYDVRKKIRIYEKNNTDDDYHDNGDGITDKNEKDTKSEYEIQKRLLFGIHDVIDSELSKNKDSNIYVNKHTYDSDKVNRIVSDITDSLKHMEGTHLLNNIIESEKDTCETINIRAIGDFMDSVVIPIIYIHRSIVASMNKDKTEPWLKNDIFRKFINDVLSFRLDASNMGVVIPNEALNTKKKSGEGDHWEMEYTLGLHFVININPVVIDYINKLQSDKRSKINSNEFRGMSVKFTGSEGEQMDEVEKKMEYLKSVASKKIFSMSDPSAIEDTLVEMLLKVYMLSSSGDEMKAMNYSWNGYKSLLESSFAHIFRSVGMDYISKIQHYKDTEADILFLERLDDIPMDESEMNLEILEYMLLNQIVQMSISNAEFRFREIRNDIEIRYIEIIASDPSKEYQHLLEMYYEQWIALEMILSESWKDIRSLFDFITSGEYKIDDIEDADIIKSGMTTSLFFDNIDMKNPIYSLIRNRESVFPIIILEEDVIGEDKETLELDEERKNDLMNLMKEDFDIVDIMDLEEEDLVYRRDNYDDDTSDREKMPENEKYKNKRKNENDGDKNNRKLRIINKNETLPLAKKMSLLRINNNSDSTTRSANIGKMKKNIMSFLSKKDIMNNNIMNNNNRTYRNNVHRTPFESERALVDGSNVIFHKSIGVHSFDHLMTAPQEQKNIEQHVVLLDENKSSGRILRRQYHDNEPTIHRGKWEKNSPFIASFHTKNEDLASIGLNVSSIYKILDNSIGLKNHISESMISHIVGKYPMNKNEKSVSKQYEKKSSSIKSMASSSVPTKYYDRKYIVSIESLLQ